ncbi:MAG: triose-phosphate isomerase [Candidatus Solibacter usitatus]|nr:triose-phosphate isomerase [Candidatus Solibacter usitatus]
MRKTIIAGNWKMYKTVAEAKAFFQRFVELVREAAHCEIVVCPPFPALAAAAEAAAGSNVAIGAQNLYWGKEGAFTGEVSGPMLRAIGCQYAIVGHSERRQYFGETNETVLKRTQAALEYGLTPIVCVGETLAQREAGQTGAVLIEQFRQGIAVLPAGQFARIVLAYEPVWAIGTGRVATPQIAADAHRLIRAEARAVYGEEAAGAIRILYGGSVKPDNVQGLMAQPDIDGALVGGASLDPVSFASIVNF